MCAILPAVQLEYGLQRYYPCQVQIMTNAITGNQEWAEPLPAACPPSEAKLPNGDPYYRLVKIFPPKIDDFHSLQMLFPGRSFSNPCRARAVSLFNSRSHCLGIRKLASHRSELVVVLDLPKESGVLMQTGKDPCHFSWWRIKSFDPVKCCKQVAI